MNLVMSESHIVKSYFDNNNDDNGDGDKYKIERKKTNSSL